MKPVMINAVDMCYYQHNTEIRVSYDPAACPPIPGIGQVVQEELNGKKVSGNVTSILHFKENREPGCVAVVRIYLGIFINFEDSVE